MRFLTAASTLLMVAACGQQEQGPAPSENAAAPEAAAGPPLPDWAAQYMGQSFAAAFPNRNVNCLGSTYAVNVEGTFARITGWSWDRSARRAYNRLISIGPDGVINGAGTTTTDRPDVVRARPDEVTDPHVGFELVSTATSGRISIAALGPDAGAFCWIKHIDLQPQAPEPEN